MSGKGDKRRPQVVTAEEFARRWDRAFGEAKPEKEKK